LRAAILLAGGRSRRFIGANKLLVHVRGRPLVRHALDAALAAPVGRVIVVTGWDRTRVARAVRGNARVRIAHAPDHDEGIAASLRAGLAALWPCERAVFVFLGDMTHIPPSLTRRVARALRPGFAAARPRSRGVPGHPALLRRPAPAIVAALRGDRGFAGLIDEPVRWIETTPHALGDIDRRRDLRR